MDATGRCLKHGGGKRCEEAGCPRSAVGGTKLCTKHMPRCQAVCTYEPGAEPVSCLYAGWLDP